MTTTEETLFEFPCEYPLKVVGPATLEFEARIVAIIRKHIPTLGEAAVTVRYSKERKYAAITAILIAESKDQLDELYKELSADKDVVMAL